MTTSARNKERHNNNKDRHASRASRSSLVERPTNRALQMTGEDRWVGLYFARQSVSSRFQRDETAGSRIPARSASAGSESRARAPGWHPLAVPCYETSDL